MNEINISFANANDINSIVSLNKDFVKENCCNGMVEDDAEYLKTKNIAVAKNGEEVVGYCYGEFEIKNRDTSMFKKGQKSFYIEELYVSKSFRNKNIGKMLYDFIESFAKENGCNIIETTAVSKNYKALLKFYIEKSDMCFWSASLVKQLNK